MIFVQTIIALFILSVCIDQGSALRCYDCSSINDRNCADKFDNRTIGLVSDCARQQPYDLSPKSQECVKLKYQENGEWVYKRGCNVLEQKPVLADVQVYLCKTDACNSADDHGPMKLLTTLAIPIILLQLLSF